MVRYRGNDYSVPVAFGHRDVWIKGFVGRVTIGCAAEVIADHPRSYETDDMVFNPLHYLPLIERKIMAFDQAAPLQDWTDTFGTERLTGALLDRLTHHVNILEMNGESYRLNQSRAKRLTP